MEKEFVPYQEALELKALGFDEPCFKYIYVGDTGNNYDHFIDVRPSESKNYNEDSLCVSQPTFSQAFRWFRDKHNTLATIYSNASGYLFEWHDSIGGTHRGWSEYDGPNDSGVWDSYEEAELSCLRKLIEIVKSK